MFPDSGFEDGGTQVAFVLFRWDAERFLNLNAYGSRGKIKVIFQKADDSPVSAVGFALREPWSTAGSHPGAAMGWAANAPTLARTYGDGYLIYDGKHTWLQDLPRNTMKNGVVCNHPTDGWCETWVKLLPDPFMVLADFLH